MHLELLLNNRRWDSASLVQEIIPIYWEGVRSLDPQYIYRPLYYIHSFSGMRNFRHWTRFFLNNIAQHLEGTLYHLVERVPRSPRSKPFGQMIHALHQEGIISDKLASELLAFNKAVVIPAKHITARYYSKNRLDTRTFNVREAAIAFVMMRKLSMKLFELLETRGVVLPHGWKKFEDRWLVWDRKIRSRKISNAV